MQESLILNTACPHVHERCPSPWGLFGPFFIFTLNKQQIADKNLCRFFGPACRFFADHREAFRGASPAARSDPRSARRCIPRCCRGRAVSDARVQLQDPRLTEARPRTAREVPAQPAGLPCSARLSGVFALVEPVLRPAVTHTSRGRHTGTAAGASHAGKGGSRTEPRTPAPRTSALLRSSLALTQLLLLCAASNSRPVVRIIRRPVRSLRLRRHGGRLAHDHAPAVLPVRDRGTTGRPHSARTPA